MSWCLSYSTLINYFFLSPLLKGFITYRFYCGCLQEHEIEPELEEDKIQRTILVLVINSRRDRIYQMKNNYKPIAY